jgi:hypothetical protein
MTLRVPLIRQRPFGCPLGAAARLGDFEPIREEVAAVIARPGCDLLSPRHAIRDHILGQPIGHHCARML